MASMAMTEQTPKMMPSMVSMERSLWSSRLLKPSRRMTEKLEVSQRAHDA